MKKFYRALMVISVFFLIGMTLLTVRFVFDRRDMKKACALVLSHTVLNASPDALRANMAEALGVVPEQVFCEARIISRYEKKLVVACGEQGPDSFSSPDSFLWLADLVNQTVSARNEVSRKLLERVVRDDASVSEERKF